MYRLRSSLSDSTCSIMMSEGFFRWQKTSVFFFVLSRRIFGSNCQKNGLISDAVLYRTRSYLGGIYIVKNPVQGNAVSSRRWSYPNNICHHSAIILPNVGNCIGPLSGHRSVHIGHHMAHHSGPASAHFRPP